MGLISLAMVSAVRTVKAMEYIDRHRRQAKVLIDSCFESSFHYKQYKTAMSGVEIIDGIVIDPREGGAGDDLTGTLTIQVSEDYIEVDEDTEFSAKTIELIISWEEPGDGPQEVLMSKVITSLP